MCTSRSLFTLIFFAISFQVFSQATFSDSLDIALAGKPDSLQKKILVDVFNAYSAGNYQRARVAGNKALNFLRRSGMNDQLANFLLRLGQTEYTYGNHDLALKHYIESAEIYQNLQRPALEASVYNEIAVLHRKNNNPGKSKEYIGAAFELFKHAYDTNGMATTLCNIGIANEIDHKPEVALTYYRQALSLYVAFNCELCISYALDYIAGAHKILHQFDSAFYYENKSLALRRKLDNKYTIAQSLMTLGEIYFEQGKYKNAISYFKETAALCGRINFKDYERTAYQYLAKSSERSGAYKEAYNYHVMFTRLDDSLFNETRSAQINELQVLYETEKNESEIESLQQQQQIKNLTISEQFLQIRNRNYLLAVVIIFAVTFIAGGNALYRQRRLKMRLLYEGDVKKREETERLRIAKDIHDEIGSGLAKIHFLSQDILQKSLSSDGERNVNSVKEISSKLIDNMRDLVWELNTANTTLDTLIAQIREYSTDYMEDLPLEMIAIFPEKIPAIQLRKLVYRNVLMMVKEALNNIVKHSRASHVYLEMEITGDQLNITIKDDGIGFNKNTMHGGNGLANMKSRIEAIGGIFTISGATTGTVVSVSIALT